MRNSTPRALHNHVDGRRRGAGDGVAVLNERCLCHVLFLHLGDVLHALPLTMHVMFCLVTPNCPAMSVMLTDVLRARIVRTSSPQLQYFVFHSRRPRRTPEKPLQIVASNAKMIATEMDPWDRKDELEGTSPEK